jgi:hypothetical protein
MFAVLALHAQTDHSARKRDCALKVQVLLDLG